MSFVLKIILYNKRQDETLFTQLLNNNDLRNTISIIFT